MKVAIDAITFSGLSEDEAFVFLDSHQGFAADLVRQVKVKAGPDSFHTLGDSGSTLCEDLSTPVLLLRVFSSLKEPSIHGS